MRRSRLAIPLIALGFLALAAPSRAAGGDEATFEALVDRLFAAWNTLDVDEPAKLYAKDVDLVFFDVVPLEYHGWDEYAAGVKAHFLDVVTQAKLTPTSEPRIERRGSVAWTTVTFHLSATFKDGNRLEADGRQTLVWEKLSNGWRIVHEHTSLPLGP